MPDIKCSTCNNAIFDDFFGEYGCKKKQRNCTESELAMGCTQWAKIGTKDKDPKPEIITRSGATFTPHVSESGVLSWTNDKGLPNPASTHLTKGLDGKDGKDGYTPIKGVDYFDGEDGAPGKDGYTPIKGIDYFDGEDGKDGMTFTTDESLSLKDGVLSVNTAKDIDSDNTLPITAAAVASTVGNIEILLRTI